MTRVHGIFLHCRCAIQVLSHWSTWTLLVSMCIPYAFGSSGSGGWVDERKSRREAATRRESAASGRAEDGAWGWLEIPGGGDKADAHNAFKQSCRRERPSRPRGVTCTRGIAAGCPAFVLPNECQRLRSHAALPPVTARAISVS